MGQSFIVNHLATIGADFSSQKVPIDDDNIELQIWDLAGQKNFETIRSRFYHGAKGSLVVFDLTDEESFQDIQKWIDEIFKNSGSGTVPLILIGNKVDLDTQRVISQKAIVEKIKLIEEQTGLDIMFFETSAKTGENVENAFQTFAKILREESKK